MRSVIKTNKNPDTEGQGIFLSFKKHCKGNEESLIKELVKNKKHIIVTESWKKIFCLLQEFHGKLFVDSSYGCQYHILLQQGNTWYGCNIEHRNKPSCENGRLLNPTSRKVSLLKEWSTDPIVHQNPPELEEVNSDIIAKLHQA